MITGILIVSVLWAIILTVIVDRIVTVIEKREADKRRQAAKRYYMMMYFDAPSLREAEYWLAKYNEGK